MLPDVQTILYASDLGPNMRPAFRFAVSLAQRFHARIVMLHVLEPIGSTSRSVIEDYLDAAQLRRLQQEGYDRILGAMQERLARFYADEQVAVGEMSLPEVEIVVLTGPPAETIVAEAQKRQVELIVMGSHTDPSLGHRLMGSTTRMVTHISHLPVMVVPAAGT